MDKIDVRSSQLSGGQKRKLSLAIALIGDPQVGNIEHKSDCIYYG